MSSFWAVVFWTSTDFSLSSSEQRLVTPAILSSSSETFVSFASTVSFSFSLSSSTVFCNDELVWLSSEILSLALVLIFFISAFFSESFFFDCSSLSSNCFVRFSFDSDACCFDFSSDRFCRFLSSSLRTMMVDFDSSDFLRSAFNC